MKKQFTLFDDEGTIIKSTTYSDEGLNTGWIVMYKKNIIEILNKCKELTKLKVFMFLASQQTYDSIVVANMAYISKQLKISYKSTWLAIKWLEENQIVVRIVKNGVHGFLINPKYTTCGRKSLKEKRSLWDRMIMTEKHVDTGTGEIIEMKEIPIEEKEIELTDKLIKQIFGEDKGLSLPDDEEEEFDPFGLGGSHDN